MKASGHSQVAGYLLPSGTEELWMIFRCSVETLNTFCE